MTDTASKTQPLFLVLGGELISLDSTLFKHPDNVDVVGIFQTRDAAQAAWKAKAQSTVDNAHMRYFIIDLASVLSQVH